MGKSSLFACDCFCVIMASGSDALLAAPKPDVMIPNTSFSSTSRPLSRQCSSVFYPEVLVFEGGGTKGIHYAGALKHLEDAGILNGVQCFAGTSAGAQTAALLAFGFNGTEMEELMLTASWADLLDGSNNLCCCQCYCCGYGWCK